MGEWIGKGKFVFSHQEKQDFKNKKIQEYNDKYISVSRLKKEMNYTDKLILDYLPKPKKLYINSYGNQVKGWEVSIIKEIEINNIELSKKLEKRRLKNEKITK